MQSQSLSIQSSAGISRTFWRYAIPSIAAMLVSGLYQIIDGVFVGHYMGAEGLAAINMAWPVVFIIGGVGLMIGMGCGSLISMSRGEGLQHKAQQALSTGFGLLLVVGVALMALMLFVGQYLLIAQGARDLALKLATEYVDVFGWCALLTITAAAIPILVRNDESPNLATVLMVLGALLNIVLDYLLIGHLGWGLRGAAIATVLAQAAVCLGGIGYFLLGRSQLGLRFRLAFGGKLAGRILLLGASCLVMYLYTSFVVGLHNWLFVKYGTELTVGAFAIVGYLMTLYYLIAEGVGEGVQPQVSYYFGAREDFNIQKVMKLATKVTLVAGVLWIGLLNFFPDPLISLFNGDNQALMSEAANGIRLHLFAIFLDGFIVLASVYFMSVNQGGKALGISVGNMAIQLPFLFFLPQWLGVNGVWLALPLSNIALFAIVAPMVWRDLQQRSAVAPVGISAQEPEAG
ncbi:MATE family efflux transporter [Dongshaea marina]|uniref:MATE family efflux transporter n=1 Tax=Dongshaea marina TaxID=2047966 RepID=UPI000D3E9D2F|nr:MATE family efflux transporter [Dongshaea marina]